MKTIAIPILAMLFLTTSLLDAHSDIRPRVQAGKIVADGFDDGTSALEPNLRVFGYDFGENTDDPFFTQDPGFNSASGSGLTAGSSLSFSLLGSLGYWNGTGGVSFSPVTTGETFALNFGAQTRTVAGSSTPQAGFAIQTIGAGGTVHRHLNAFLNGPDGNTLPAGAGSWGAGDGVQAANGVYLFAIQLSQDPAGGIAPSDPIYLAFNNGLTEELHDQAIEWINANLVPEPGTLCLLAIAAGLGFGRRRRHRLSIDTP